MSFLLQVISLRQEAWQQTAICAGTSVTELLRTHFKYILGTVYPFKHVDEEGKQFVKTLLSSTVGETLPGR